ncbi:MAG: tRNA threonylcarbamoyladenosine dehydratase [Candidatus Cryptobacteroides sp.]
MNNQISQREIFTRLELLVGEEMMEKLSNTKVIIFGVGGVGSWCAEGLIRSGIGNLTIVDFDDVTVCNINRQLMATTKTIGKSKVEVLKDRLREINPYAEITAIQDTYSKDSAEKFELSKYDYIIDAVDSLSNKANLILRACESGAVFFSSMGAALKISPLKIKTAEFWDVIGCPLGAALRKKFKQNKTLPAHPFICVYDAEVLQNKGKNKPENTESKQSINGTTASVTAIFGFTLSGLVIEHIYNIQ